MVCTGGLSLPIWRAIAIAWRTFVRVFFFSLVDLHETRLTSL